LARNIFEEQKRECCEEIKQYFCSMQDMKVAANKKLSFYERKVFPTTPNHKAIDLWTRAF